ncbi:Hemolymph lipopolysaccharide-binding protein [Eumeta japonica]|uniref:Hemolymph lipopolysaccharide-binding protein n=1 Tax=Eumeta variegata TaxID=151549 RepID=A0A4C1UGE4_EUMVA|nr:Hemolymph lipopolysaccharide-binding protein [Eumeta japonica]
MWSSRLEHRNGPAPSVQYHTLTEYGREIAVSAAAFRPVTYKPNGDLTRCYKIHKEPKTWADAYMTCEVEKSYLAIIDDKEEADFIVNGIKPLFDEIPGNYNKTLISVGFHDKFKEGIFLTVKGKSLNTAYNIWAAGQPDDEFGNDDCGAISVRGQLHDMPCDNQRTLFVCERDISQLKSSGA